MPVVHIHLDGLQDFTTSPKGSLTPIGGSTDNLAKADAQRIQELEAELKSQTIKAELWNAEVFFLLYI